MIIQLTQKHIDDSLGYEGDSEKCPIARSASEVIGKKCEFDGDVLWIYEDDIMPQRFGVDDVAKVIASTFDDGEFEDLKPTEYEVYIE